MNIDRANKSKIVEALQHYESHPIDFCNEVLGARLDFWQCNAAMALQQHHFLAIRSGSGVGKTAFLSFMLIWFLSTKPFCKIPTTAPSQHQLFDLLWAECFRWISQSKFLQNLLVWTQSKISVRGHEPHWYAVARTASVSPGGSVAEGLQGFHSEDNLLFILDEASGIPDAIFPAVEGALTGENAYCIMAGNPTRLEGYFYDVFHKERVGKRYKKMHVSCLDSSRVTKQYVDMMEERYGREHPVYRIKVLGDFPSADDELLVPPSFVEEMQNNSKDRKVSPTMPIEVGVDLGRVKASSVACIRQGFNILEWKEKHRPGGVTDTNELTAWVIDIIHEYSPQIVRIDALNIGMGVCDNLTPIYAFVIPIVGQAKAPDSDRYVNLRAQGYWTLRDIIPKLWCKSWPQRLITELGDIRKKSSRIGKMAVESKDEMRGRSLRSPDFADALMYAFCSGADGTPVIERPPVDSFLALNADLSSGDDGGSRWAFQSRHKSGWTSHGEGSRW